MKRWAALVVLLYGVWLLLLTTPLVLLCGIVCGLTVMLMSFGPGVLFLFVARARRLRPSVGGREPPLEALEKSG